MEWEEYMVYIQPVWLITNIDIETYHPYLIYTLHNLILLCITQPVYIAYEVYTAKQVTKFPVMTSKKDSHQMELSQLQPHSQNLSLQPCKVYLAYCGKASLCESWWTYVTSKKIINIVACVILQQYDNNMSTVCQQSDNSVSAV